MAGLVLVEKHIFLQYLPNKNRRLTIRLLCIFLMYIDYSMLSGLDRLCPCHGHNNFKTCLKLLSTMISISIVLSYLYFIPTLVFR